MKIRIDKSFDRDVDRIKNKKTLGKLQDFISLIEKPGLFMKFLIARKYEDTLHYIGLELVIIGWASR